MKVATEQALSFASQYAVGKVRFKVNIVCPPSPQRVMASPLPREIKVNEDVRWPTFRMFLQNGEALVLLTIIAVGETLLL